MLLSGPLLQGLQPVSTTTIRHLVPEVTRLHAVLSDVAPFCTRNQGSKRREYKTKYSLFNKPIASNWGVIQFSSWHTKEPCPTAQQGGLKSWVWDPMWNEHSTVAETAAALEAWLTEGTLHPSQVSLNRMCFKISMEKRKILKMW